MLASSRAFAETSTVTDDSVAVPVLVWTAKASIAPVASGAIVGFGDGLVPPEIAIVPAAGTVTVKPGPVSLSANAQLPLEAVAPVTFTETGVSKATDAAVPQT